MGRFLSSPESKKLTFSRSLLPTLYLSMSMHNLSLELAPRPSAVVFKRVSLIFLYSISAQCLLCNYLDKHVA